MVVFIIIIISIIYTLTNEIYKILCLAPIERASSPRSMGIGVGTGVGNIRGQAMSQASGSSHSQHSLSR